MLAIIHNKPCKTSGLTLLEVLIALTILSITLVALSKSQSQSLAVTGESRTVTTLALLAQGKMAEMEGRTPLENINENGDFGDDYPGFVWQVKVSDFDRLLKKIDVSVKDKRRTKDKGLQLVLYKYASTEAADKYPMNPAEKGAK